MASGRQNKLAGQVAEHLVCAELGRRGLIATPFAGNVPTFDVLATDLECRTVPLQVKATRGDRWPSDARLWLDVVYDERSGIQHNRGPLPLTNPELIYVCVALHGPDDDKRDRYFILTKADVQDACVQIYVAYITPRVAST
jgi:hypothetical protein